MTPIQKTWGVVRSMFESPGLALHHLDVRSGHSSLHAHVWMWNRFYVRTARIGVSVSTRSGWTYMELGPGSILDIPPKTLHRFAVLRPGSVWEVYWPEESHAVHADDIVRLDDGSDVLTCDNKLDGLLPRVYASSSRVRESTPAATGFGQPDASPRSGSVIR